MSLKMGWGMFLKNTPSSGVMILTNHTNTIVAAFGTNRIEANGMLSTNITFDFNSFSTAAQITIGYTDDNGTNGSYSSQSIDVDVQPVCTLAASEGATL